MLFSKIVLKLYIISLLQFLSYVDVSVMWPTIHNNHQSILF